MTFCEADVYVCHGFCGFVRFKVGVGWLCDFPFS